MKNDGWEIKSGIWAQFFYSHYWRVALRIKKIFKNYSRTVKMRYKLLISAFPCYNGFSVSFFEGFLTRLTNFELSRHITSTKAASFIAKFNLLILHNPCNSFWGTTEKTEFNKNEEKNQKWLTWSFILMHLATHSEILYNCCWSSLQLMLLKNTLMHSSLHIDVCY